MGYDMCIPTKMSIFALNLHIRFKIFHIYQFIFSLFVLVLSLIVFAAYWTLTFNYMIYQ